MNSSLIYSTLDDDPVPPTPIVYRVHTSRVLFYFNGKAKAPYLLVPRSSVAPHKENYIAVLHVCMQRSSIEVCFHTERTAITQPSHPSHTAWLFQLEIYFSFSKVFLSPRHLALILS